MISSLISLGLFGSLPFSGFLILKYTKSITENCSFLSGYTRFALYTALGMCFWSLPMLASALLGIYSSIFFGLCGWTVILLTLWKSKTIFKESYLLKGNSISSVLLLLGVLIIAYIYLAFPNESILGGRDQGVYANHGVYIANHGKTSVDYPLSFNDLKFIDNFLPGLYKTTEHITVQFSYLFPVWLAQSYSVMGSVGLFGFNGVMSIISLSLFYGLLRQFVISPYAILGVFVLGLNASQIWFSRITLTEILTQVWVIAAILTFALAVKEGNSSWARISGIFWGLTVFCRVDSLLVLPLLLIACALYFSLNYNVPKRNSNVWFSLFQTSIPMFIIGVFYYMFFSRPYFLDLTKQLFLIGLLILASLIFLGTVLKIKNTFDDKFRKNFYVIVIFFICTAFLYAHLARPHLEPFNLYNWPGTGLDGTRTYRENSILNLGFYLSIPLMYFSLIGWVLAFRKMWFNASTEWLVPLIVMGGFAAGYIYDPNISPDFHWKIRRFVPIIIPGFIIFAVFAISELVKHIPKAKSIVIGSTLILLLVTFNIYNNYPVLMHKENEGVWSQLEDVSRYLPDQKVIFADHNLTLWRTPLFMSFNKRIIPLEKNSYDSAEFYDTFNKIIKKENEVFFLTTVPVQDYNFEQIHSFKLSTNFMEQTTTVLPTKVLNNTTEVFLYKIREGNRGKGRLYGGQSIFGIRDSGFHGQEINSKGEPFRWTNGNAQIFIPWDNNVTPKLLNLSLYLTGPKGNNITIKVNDFEIFRGKVEPGEVEKNLVIDRIKLNYPVKVEIISDTWRPSETIANSNDSRNLGVAVKSIKLLE